MAARPRIAHRSPILGHLRHHVRFYAAALFGALVGLVAGEVQLPVRLMLAGDGFFLLYLMLVTEIAARMTPSRMRHRASFEDVGLALIALITVAEICLSLSSIFALLNDGDKPTGAELALSIGSVFLGWLTLHTVIAFHYAHLYYQRVVAPRGGHGEAGGLLFPGTSEPVISDFLYQSFIIGMTAQVSDVQITTAAMRRLALCHGMLSFAFNTVLLAIVINVVAGQVH